jgi:hypothetical protein
MTFEASQALDGQMPTSSRLTQKNAQMLRHWPDVLIGTLIEPRYGRCMELVEQEIRGLNLNQAAHAWQAKRVSSP